MNANDDLGRRLADLYDSEVSPRAPDRVLAATLEAIDDIPQRRVFISAPWRSRNMNSLAKLAIAAVVVIAVGAVGWSLFGPRSPSQVGGAPPAPPSPSLSPTPSGSPSASTVTAAPLTGAFTSERHGFTLSYPAAWDTRPAIESWRGQGLDFASAAADVIFEPVLQDHLFLMITSQPLGGKTGEQWIDDTIATLTAAGECEAPVTPTTIEGGSGQMCGAPSAAVAATAGDRGYVITMYVSPDDPVVGEVYDTAYFEQILATVVLQPEDAVDTPASASPAP